MDIEKVILDSTKYNGHRDNPYTFSASMSGNTVLQNYLTIVYGHTERNRMDDTTLGSVFHLGLEHIFKQKFEDMPYVFSTEEPAAATLDNGWTISGTTDLVIRDESGTPISIHDWKLIKSYAVKKIAENPQNHHYAKQLHINNFIRGGRFRLYIETFAKDPDAIKAEKTYTQFEIARETTTQTEQYLLATTNELQGWVESGDAPPKCDDVWLRKISKTSTAVIPSRCMFYCSHGKAGLCPHYAPDNATRNAISLVKDW